MGDKHKSNINLCDLIDDESSDGSYEEIVETRKLAVRWRDLDDSMVYLIKEISSPIRGNYGNYTYILTVLSFNEKYKRENEENYERLQCWSCSGLINDLKYELGERFERLREKKVFFIPKGLRHREVGSKDRFEYELLIR